MFGLGFFLVVCRRASDTTKKSEEARREGRTSSTQVCRRGLKGAQQESRRVCTAGTRLQRMRQKMNEKPERGWNTPKEV